MRLNAHFLPVVRHGLDLGMVHRMITKVFHSSRTGRGDSDLPNGRLVGDDVGTDVIDRPHALNCPIHCCPHTHIAVDDKSSVFNTDWLYAIELAGMLEVADAMSHSAIQREESRGSHQRLDDFGERDDVNFLKHSLAYYDGAAAPRIEYMDVNITRSQPAKRVYGAEAEQTNQEQKEANHA